KKGPFSDKDQLIVEIERYRIPDFYYGRIRGDIVVPTDDINNGENIAHIVESISNVDQTINERNDGRQETSADSNDDGVILPFANDISDGNKGHDNGVNADDDGGFILSAAFNNVNDIINEPNESLRSEYYQAAIRAFRAFSELTEIKLQMIRSQR
uniref:Uncharacterized protein n=1 Tax=Panagrolaimus sp. ES5 TaxID=591445 RepID=A0AC34G5P7_9BILA